LGFEADIAGSGLCPGADFSVGLVETSVSVIVESVSKAADLNREGGRNIGLRGMIMK
jgi:hypothetical protein